MPRQLWRYLLLLLLVPLGSPALYGQAPPQQLSLEEATDLARRNNPGFLATENDIRVADWDVRSAYGAWVPSASLSGSMGWQGQGEQVLAGALTASQFGVTGQPDYYSSSYRAGVSWSLSGQTLFAPSQAKASRDATQARVNEARMVLEFQVTRLYLDVLRQDEGVLLAGQQLDRANFNLRLAEAQAEVGSATLLDVRQAEVQVGRAEVGLLQAQNARVTAGLRLLQQIGVDPAQEVELTSGFVLEEPLFDEERIFQEALTANPSLRATRESAEAAGVGEKIAHAFFCPEDCYLSSPSCGL